MNHRHNMRVCNFRLSESDLDMLQKARVLCPKTRYWRGEGEMLSEFIRTACLERASRVLSQAEAKAARAAARKVDNVRRGRLRKTPTSRK